MHFANALNTDAEPAVVIRILGLVYEALKNDMVTTKRYGMTDAETVQTMVDSMW